MKKIFWLIFCYCLFNNSHAQASYIEVTLLGTGTPKPSIDRFGPATLVETKGKLFLFDTGRGTTIRLQQAGVSLADINHVFYSHLHSDHVSGLADLWLTSWIWQRQNQLNIYGPIGVDNLVKHTQLAHENDIIFRSENAGLNPDNSTIITNEITADRIVYDKNGVKVTAFLVNHGLVKPAFGYRIDSGEQSVVISGDTTYSDNLIQHAKNADLLIHEIAVANPKLLEKNPRLQKIIAYHTTPKQAAEVFKHAEPKAVVLTHILLFGTKEQELMTKIRMLYDGPVELGQDLMKIGIGENITFRNPK